MFYNMSLLEKVLFLKRNGGGSSSHEETSYIGSFVTNMAAPLRKLLVSFMPKQDLHGYDKPWAGGNGKNCLDIDALFAAPQGTLYSGDSPYTFPHVLEMVLKPNTTYVVSSDYTIANKQRIIYVDTASSTDSVYKVNSVVKTTGSDGILKIGFFDNRTGSEEFLNGTVYLQVEEGSTATDYEPYENDCPIEGWTQVGVEHKGVNLIDDTADIWTNNRFIDGTGTVKSSNKYRYTTDLIPVEPNTTYYVQELKTRTTENAVTIPFYDENGEFLERPAVTDSTTATGIMGGTFTTTADTRYIRISCGRYSENVQLEKGDTCSDYEPYSERTYTVPFGRTVYGGTLDVVSGELVVDRAIFTFDGDPNKWAAPANWYNVDVADSNPTFGAYWYFNYSLGWNSLPKPKLYVTPTDNAKVVSDKFTQNNYGTYKQSEPYKACISGSSENNVYFGVRLPASVLSDTSSSTALNASIMEWFQNNPTEFCYLLATPQTYQLDSQQINSLIGQNNLTSDGNITEVVYLVKDE